jgi:hypothetical protein
VVDSAGEATIWTGRPGSKLDETGLIRSLREAAADDYRELIREASAARLLDAAARRRTLQRLRREMRRIRLRDHFPPPEAEHARMALEELGELVEARA